MTVFALVLVLFLQGGVVASKVAVAPVSKEDCEASAAVVAASYQDQKVPVEGQEDKLLVLDAQALCVPVTQQTHA